MKMLNLLKSPIDKKISIDDMANFYAELHFMYEMKQYNDISEIMHNIDVENTNFTVLNGLIRYTFVKRNYIKGWENFLEKVQQFSEKNYPQHSINKIKY